MEVGRKHSNLGIQLEFLSGALHIDIQNYISKVLHGFVHRFEEYQTPGIRGLFAVSEESSELGDGDWQQFHTIVAKLPYLAKRA